MLTISILNNINWKFVHHKVDRIINLCGPGPRGTGLQNLREAIIQTKWKYDLAMEDKQVQDDIVCSLTRYIHRKAGEHAFLASWNGNFFTSVFTELVSSFYILLPNVCWSYHQRWILQSQLSTVWLPSWLLFWKQGTFTWSALLLTPKSLGLEDLKRVSWRWVILI